MRKTLILIVIALTATGAWAADEPANPTHVQTRMLADVATIAPGAMFRVGVEFTVEDEWHIYWINPGEAGLPTQAEFAGPAGFLFNKVQYPEPIYFGAGTSMAGYGYEKKVLLFAEVKAPEALSGENVTFTAKASWLVCRHVCVPGAASVTLTLPVGAAATPSADQLYFSKITARVPVPSERISGIEITPTFNTSGIFPGSEFEMLYVVAATDGAQLAPRRDEHVHTFNPLPAGNYEIVGTQVDDPAPTPRPQIAVRVKIATFPELTEEDEVGGVFLFDRVVDGERTPTAVEYRIPIPVVKPGTAVTPVPLPEFTPPATGATTGGPARSVWLMVLFAFVGGIILNVMPCVLPVVSIKILSLVGQAHLSRAEIRRHGLAYAGGILLSFAALAAGVAILKSGGETVGWGFQFQSPLFVALLGAVVFVFGLSLLDVFILTAPTTRALHEAGAKEGLRGSFFNGVFATVLATPCTAPFLGTAIGFAFTQPLAVTFAIFMAVGLGLAFPFVMLAFAPAWTRFLPKPGAWMETFKSLMGFLLMATVVWLLDVLGKQTGAAGLTRMTAYLGVLGFAAWLFGRFGNVTRETRTRVLATVVAVLLTLGGGWLALRFAPPEAAAAVAREPGGIAWEPFSEQRVAELTGEGRTVFIDFTAAWCWTCKVNEKAVIETAEVREAIERLHIAPLKGDWTNRDAGISAYLKRLGKAGVPVYAIISPTAPGEPIVLPEVVTKEMVIRALEKAASPT